MKRIAAILITICLLISAFNAYAANDQKQTTLSGIEPAIFLGRYHGLALTRNGILYAWGDNRYGQTDDILSVTQSPQVVMERVISAAAGQWTSYAVTEDGILWAWGNNEQGQIGVGDSLKHLGKTEVMSGVRSVYSSLNLAYAIKDDGSIWAWGNSPYLYPDASGEYLKLDKLPRTIPFSADKIICGGSTTLFLRENSLYGFGSGVHGSLDENNRISEKHISDKVVDAYPTNTGVVYTLTNGWFGHTTGTSINFGNNKLTRICSHDKSFGTITSNGELLMWGENKHGQLGNGSTTYSMLPVKITSNISSAAIGDGFTVVMKTNGELWSWGDNTHSQLGSGTDRNSYNYPHMILRGEYSYPQPEGKYHVVLNGSLLSFDSDPVNRSGRVLVPMRGISEALGASVKWDNNTRTAEALLNGNKLSFTIDSNIAYINGEEYLMDVPAVIEKSRTMVPVRFLCEAFNAYVRYIPSDKLIEIVENISTEISTQVSVHSTAIEVELGADIGVGHASGVLVSSDGSSGLVLTNRHVTENALSITVILSDGSVLKNCPLVYQDKDRDFALVKVTGKLPNPAAFGNTLTLREGDTLLVCGGDGQIIKTELTRFGAADNGSILLSSSLPAGMSGSGVYSSTGLSALIWGNVGNYTAAIPIEYFLPVISKQQAILYNFD